MRLLVVIFILALLIRFLYFPNDIYFGFDQARDAFAATEILKGDIKLIGPTTSFEGLNHGVLYYYLYAPFYLIGQADPSWAASMLRIVNSLGVFLIFILSTSLFNIYVGIIAAFFYAVSFEQTQFALYFNHPSFAVISILLLFLGLSLLIFRRKDFGLIIALAGLGLSIQFEFILTYLIIPFTLVLLIFRKSIPAVSIKIKLLGMLTLFLTLLTFIVSEIKYGFRSFNFLFQFLFGLSEKSFSNAVTLYLFEMGQVIKFNLTGNTDLKLFAALILVLSLFLLLFSSIRKQIIFLSIWFFSGVVVYFVNRVAKIDVDIIQYHPNVGLSLPLIIFVSYLIFMVGRRAGYLSVIIIILILAANFSLINKINPYGSMPEINSQSFMLLSDEKKVLDYLYQDANGREFAVKAISIPFYVNTTWSYLFQWYGRGKYGYLPIWNGVNALGYPGNLIVEDAQDKAPPLRYLIIEPLRGIPVHLINDYLREESYFTDIEKQVKIGEFQVQVRRKK